jgi:hypothetical protein
MTKSAFRMVALALVLGAWGVSCKGGPPSFEKIAPPRLIVTLPDEFNTPDGCTVTDGGDVILSCPNFNNGALKKAGMVSKDFPARMARIDKDNKLTSWYEFARQDLHPDTGTVGPMGCDIGPDGHLYVADNHVFETPNHKSRLLRIRIQGGRAVGCDVVVEGFIVSNAVIWRGDTVYVSETFLKVCEKGQPLISGVYAIKMDEWKNGPVKLQPWSAEKADPHLIAVYKTSNRIGFGADGLTFDCDGNLYCGIFEDGIVYRTRFSGGKALPPEEFARDPKMACCDGIFWSPADQVIFVADMLNNAVQAVDLKGRVTTVWKNGDTDGADGSLDQPCEVAVRGRELIVINMDMWWECPWLVNKKIDRPFTVSSIRLP